MRSYDLSPLFRSTVGFDRLSRLMESAMSADEQALAYPPYNIEKTGDDAYRIAMAVAGFSEAELDIVVQDQSLVVRGKQGKEERPVEYLHRGIAARAFERRFQLADHIKVVGASLNNGLLYVDLAREVPERLKPRQIPIAAGPGPRTLETDKAA